MELCGCKNSLVQVASLSWCLFFGGVGGYSAVHAAAVIVIQYNSGYKSYEFFFFFFIPKGTDLFLACYTDSPELLWRSINWSLTTPLSHLGQPAESYSHLTEKQLESHLVSEFRSACP